MPSHLTLEERDRIAQWRHQGANQQEIARALDRDPGTISRELRRNRTDGEYLAAQAQRASARRRRERPLDRKMDDPKINAAVRAGLAQQWSPQQIVGRRAQQGEPRSVSHQTIYAWIQHSAERAHWETFLRRRGQRPCRLKKPGRPEAARIRNRPAVIERRERLGDFEGDTVLGPPGTGGLVTLVDRQSRLTIMDKVKSKDADLVQQKIRDRLKELDEAHRRSLTFDNGTEFARSHRLEKHLDLQLYFADPGCPYQRGTNENTNGLIRQYFPKGTDFRDITHRQVRAAEHQLNHRPRACLGFRTPHEVFYEKTPPTGCD